MQFVPDTRNNERIALFVDYHNTLHALRRAGRQIDLAALKDYLADGRHLLEAFLYIASHPAPERQEADRASLQRLRESGFLVRTRTGQLLPDGRLKCDFDLEMALDVQDFAARTRPDIVVLVTGDGDFTPLAQRLRLQGIRVEVASTPGCSAASLRAMASGFVDLTQLGHEIENLPLPDLGPDEDDEPLADPELAGEAPLLV